MLTYHSARRTVKVVVVLKAVAVAVATRTLTVLATLSKDLLARLLTLVPQQLQQMILTPMPSVSNSARHPYNLVLTAFTDGGYQNYVALWYQSLMYQQQQGGEGGNPPTGAPAPGA